MIIFGQEVFSSPLFGQIILSVFIAVLLALALTRRRSESTERKPVRMPVRDFMPERKQPIRVSENPYYSVKQRIEIPQYSENSYYSRKTAESGSASGSAVGSLAAGSAIVALLWWFIGNVAWDALKGGF